MKRYAIALSTVLFFGILLFVEGGEMGSSEIGLLGKITNLSQLHREARFALIGEAVKERQDTEKSLISYLSSPESPFEIKVLSAYLIGEYRMSAAAKHLADNITLEWDGSIKVKREVPWGRYPVVDALAKVGKPALPEVLRLIQENSDMRVRELAAQVVRDIEGPDLGRIVIEKAIAKQTNPERKQRLEAALSSKHFVGDQ